MSFKLTSSEIHEGEPIPKQFTGDGENVSPQLAWYDAPSEAKSFALICEDPDAPRGTWCHWVLFNIPADATELPQGSSPGQIRVDGAKQGKNDFGKLGYGGPAPPRGNPHRYFFKLYALDSKLDLHNGASRAELLSAMKGHILADAELMGTYRR